MDQCNGGSPFDTKARQVVADALGRYHALLKENDDFRAFAEAEARAVEAIRSVAPNLSRRGSSLSAVEHAGVIFVALPDREFIEDRMGSFRILAVPVEGIVRI